MRARECRLIGISSETARAVKFNPRRFRGVRTVDATSERNLLTFSIGSCDNELLDLRSPRHGREQLEGIRAVDLGVADVERYEATKHGE